MLKYSYVMMLFTTLADLTRKTTDNDRINNYYRTLFKLEKLIIKIQFTIIRLTNHSCFFFSFDFPNQGHIITTAGKPHL